MCLPRHRNRKKNVEVKKKMKDEEVVGIEEEEEARKKIFQARQDVSMR